MGFLKDIVGVVSDATRAGLAAGAGSTGFGTVDTTHVVTIEYRDPGDTTPWWQPAGSSLGNNDFILNQDMISTGAGVSGRQVRAVDPTTGRLISTIVI